MPETLNEKALIEGRFRKKPVVIEAYCYDQRRENSRPDWLTDAVTANTIITYPDHAIIKTLEGSMRADLGDWIIKGVKGEFYPCKPDIFEITYEPVLPAGDYAGLVERLKLQAESEHLYGFDDTEARLLEAATAIAVLDAKYSWLQSAYETAQANWDLTLDRAEAAEARVKALEGVLEEIADPETVWRRRAEEDGIRLTATDILALAKERTLKVIARAALSRSATGGE